MVTVRYVGSGDGLSQQNLSRISVMQEIVFGCIYDSSPVDAHWWIAFQNGSPVAFAALTHYEDDDTAFLSLAGVLPCARGKGLQKRFIKKREKLAAELDCRRIITYTSYDNIVSANNLIKSGYLLYEPKWDWGVTDAYYFRKVLRDETKPTGEPIDPDVHGGVPPTVSSYKPNFRSSETLPPL